jgi:energy-coupling factor transporter transmembrane protein EcfT
MVIVTLLYVALTYYAISYFYGSALPGIYPLLLIVTQVRLVLFALLLVIWMVLAVRAIIRARKRGIWSVLGHIAALFLGLAVAVIVLFIHVGGWFRTLDTTSSNGHTYYLSESRGSSDLYVRLWECDSLGIICRQLYFRGAGLSECHLDPEAAQPESPSMGHICE